MKKSPSALVKETLIDILKSQPGKHFPKNELVEQVQKRTGQEFTDGIFAGVFFKLIESHNSNVYSPERGIYVYNQLFSTEDNVTPKVSEALENCLNDIQKATKGIDIFQLEESDVKRIHRIRDVYEQISTIKENFEDIEYEEQKNK